GPDGQRVLAVTWGGYLKAWDLTSPHPVLQQTLELGGQPVGPLTDVAFSPDARFFAGASQQDNKIIQVWNIADGKIVHSLGGHAAVVTAVAFNSDGHQLATAVKTGEIRL